MNTAAKIREFAEIYSYRGWHILPIWGISAGACDCHSPHCQAPGKHPLSAIAPHGVKDATTDMSIIGSWLMMQPNANIGIATGKNSGLVVLDIDSRHGGDDSLFDLEAANGKLPPTLEVLTGGGGRHLYYKYPAGVQYVKSNAGQLGPGLDIRADGGYVVAPPSIHASGRAYEWEASSDPESDELAELPQWFIDLLTINQPSNNGHKTPTGQGTIPQGARNTFLTSEAGKMRRAGMNEPAILAALRVINQTKCQPPLDDAEIQRIAASVCRYPIGYPLTDGGNAEYFADQYEGKICYRHDRREWFVWRTPVWRPDNDGEIGRLALAAVRERQTQALNIQDIDKRKKALSFLLQSENGYRLHSLIEIARSLKPLAKSGEEFDRQEMLLAVQNGIINLETGDFREGEPEDYLTQCAGTYYDPDAKAPRWERFIGEIFQNDQDLIAFIQRAVGYTLTGLTREQMFFFAYGIGSNGKGTFLKILGALLGDYARVTSFSTFTKDRSQEGHKDDLMALEGARYVYAQESKTVGTLAEEILKNLAGEDDISGSRKFEHEHTFKPLFKVWLAANNRPKVKDVTDGFWRKVTMIPFDASFKDNPDLNLKQELLVELPGILNWALEGARAYLLNGLARPDVCKREAQLWRSDNDPLAEFLETCKIGDEYEVQTSALYQEYEKFCQLAGQKTVSLTAFSPLVEAHGFKRQKRKNGRFFIGIGL